MSNKSSAPKQRGFFACYGSSALPPSVSATTDGRPIGSIWFMISPHTFRAHLAIPGTVWYRLLKGVRYSMRAHIGPSPRNNAWGAAANITNALARPSTLVLDHLVAGRFPLATRNVDVSTLRGALQYSARRKKPGKPLGNRDVRHGQ